jgi:hypothetical protein
MIRKMRGHKAPTPPFPLETEKRNIPPKNPVQTKETQKKYKRMIIKNEMTT